MEPTIPSAATLFPALLEGLEQFRDRVSGSEGSYRQALLASGQHASVLSVSRSVLGIVRQLLVWLRGAIELVRKQLVAIDALIAIAEVATVLLRELSSLELSLPDVGEAIGEVTSSVGALAGPLEETPDLAVLPGPELLDALLGVLEQLVGSAEDGGQPGTLDQLLVDIQTLAA